MPKKKEINYKKKQEKLIDDISNMAEELRDHRRFNRDDQRELEVEVTDLKRKNQHFEQKERHLEADVSDLRELNNSLAKEIDVYRELLKLPPVENKDERFRRNRMY